MNKDSRIYVAGHRGLVGSAIVRKLQERGCTNLIVRTSAELDLRKQTLVEEFFEREQPQYVFLAAARVGGIHANNTYRAEFIGDNIAIALNVIQAAYHAGVKKLLNLGSSCIYPKLAPQPIKEEYLLTGPLEPTNEPYAIAKIAAIKLCRYFNEQYGTDFISVMPTNLYGPYDNFNLETSHVLPALIRKFRLAELLRRGDYSALTQDIRKRPLGFGLEKRVEPGDTGSVDAVLAEAGITREAVLLWGTGTPYREFLHVDDLADACIFLMERYGFKEIGEFVNVGTGEDKPIAEIAGLVRDVVGFAGEIRFDHTRPDGTPRKLLDVSKLRNLGWSAKIALREGIERTVESYIKGEA